jgi:branched-chain amino acid transport system ATP-binding protein
MPILNAKNVSVSYGKIRAVHDVSIAVDGGQTVALIGPNGAGKTSLLLALMGAVASDGSISYRGEPTAPLGVEDRVDGGLCLVPERRELFGSMTVSENLLLGGFSRRRAGMAAAEAKRDQVFQLFPRLQERLDQKAATLSGGEQQMLALGRALMSEPRLLLLDEPSLGLAPTIVRDIFRVIRSLKTSGMSLLLVEQNARAALNVADYGYVLEAGQVVAHGPAQELQQSRMVIEAYLGGTRQP